MARLLYIFCSVLLVCAATHNGQCQNQGNIWYFGIHAGLDFNGGEPTPLLDGQTYAPSPNLWNEGSSAISDSAGTLLMYTNGAKIWNRDQEVMMNGDSLMGHPSSTQSALIVPQPNSDRFFYVFTTDASENSFQNGLRYSVVDMCLDDGMGGVVSDQKNIFLFGPVSEKLAAVRHANGVDYWIVSHGVYSPVFISILLGSSGIGPVNQTSVGPTDPLGWGGQITFSSDGGVLAYAVTSSFGYLALFDFDTGTGVVSNPRVRMNPFVNMVWGLAFSPDDSKLYTTSANQGSLRQLDLSAGSWTDIQASETIIAVPALDRWRDLRLGPDGRIYLAHAESSSLGRVNMPNELGLSCSFSDNSVDLGGRLCSFGLPNFVSAYDYDSDKPQCSGVAHGLDEFHIQPTVVLSGSAGLMFAQARDYDMVEVYDANGRLFAKAALLAEGSTNIDMSAAPSGFYFFRLFGSEGVVTGRVLISGR